MSRKKNILLASTCIVLGMALAGPAAHAAEEILTAVRSTHQFYLDGEQIELECETGGCGRGHGLQRLLGRGGAD